MRITFLTTRLLICLSTFAWIISSCETGLVKNENNSKGIDTGNKEINTTEPIHKPEIDFNDSLDGLVRFMAGLKNIDPWKDSLLYKKECWRDYHNRLEKNWNKLNDGKYDSIRKWASENITITDSIIFYPFAGADFLNANLFFPNANTYILIGLEPVGTLPYYSPSVHNDTLAQYFNSLYTSLHAILNFSFFRTLSMEKDFQQKELNGTIHLLTLFLARTHHRIIDIKPIAIDTNGNELVSSYKNLKDNSGVRISFSGPDSIQRNLYYFSVNLHNSSLKRNNGFFTYIKKLGSPITYLKSASYLMHKDYFSVIRWYITHNSKALLQDDSGIPLKYFPDSAWTKTFYGRYSTIPMFSNFLQESMTEVYNDSLNIKPLPFGIGYKFKPGESNLMFAVRNALPNTHAHKVVAMPKKQLNNK